MGEDFLGRGGPSALSVIYDLAVVLLGNESMARRWNGISEHLPGKSGPGRGPPGYALHYTWYGSGVPEIGEVRHATGVVLAGTHRERAVPEQQLPKCVLYF